MIPNPDDSTLSVDPGGVKGLVASWPAAGEPARWARDVSTSLGAGRGALVELVEFALGSRFGAQRGVEGSGFRRELRYQVDVRGGHVIALADVH